MAFTPIDSKLGNAWTKDLVSFGGLKILGTTAQFASYFAALNTFKGLFSGGWKDFTSAIKLWFQNATMFQPMTYTSSGFKNMYDESGLGNSIRIQKIKLEKMQARFNKLPDAISEMYDEARELGIKSKEIGNPTLINKLGMELEEAQENMRIYGRTPGRSVSEIEADLNKAYTSEQRSWNRYQAKSQQLETQIERMTTMNEIGANITVGVGIGFGVVGIGFGLYTMAEGSKAKDGAGQVIAAGATNTIGGILDAAGGIATAMKVGSRFVSAVPFIGDVLAIGGAGLGIDKNMTVGQKASVAVNMIGSTAGLTVSAVGLALSWNPAGWIALAIGLTTTAVSTGVSFIK